MNKISVIVPIYRGKKYIRSMVRQIENCAIFGTGKYEIELLFVNDDVTESLAGGQVEIGSNIIEIRMLETDKNRGIHGARVRGLEHCIGEYVLFLDQDDKICENYMESQYQKIGEADAVVCRLINGKRLHYTSTFRFEEVITKDFMLNHWCSIVSPGQVLIRKTAIPHIWQENILINNGADDYFLWLCMMAEEKRFVLNQEVLFEHVITGLNTSEDTNQMMDSENEMINILLKRHAFTKEEEKCLYRLPDSLRRIHVAMLNQYKGAYAVYHAGMDLINRGSSLGEMKQGIKRIAVYGAGLVGVSLFTMLRYSGAEVLFYIDRNANYITLDIPAYTIEDSPRDIDGIIISLDKGSDRIKEELKKKFDCPVYQLQEILWR